MRIDVSIRLYQEGSAFARWARMRSQPEGLIELRGAIRVTLAAAGATLEPQAAAAKYTLKPTVLSLNSKATATSMSAAVSGPR